MSPGFRVRAKKDVSHFVTTVRVNRLPDLAPHRDPETDALRLHLNVKRSAPSPSTYLLTPEPDDAGQAALREVADEAAAR